MGFKIIHFNFHLRENMENQKIDTKIPKKKKKKKKKQTKKKIKCQKNKTHFFVSKTQTHVFQIIFLLIYYFFFYYFFNLEHLLSLQIEATPTKIKAETSQRILILTLYSIKLTKEKGGDLFSSSGA